MPLGSLLVRADANTRIGTGHFMRCLALAQAWQGSGGTAIFLMAGGAAALGTRLQADNIAQLRLSAQPGSTADADETAALAVRHDANWVALDGYQFSPTYQRQLKNKISHLLLFDDLGEADGYYADLLLNQNAYATPEMYSDHAGNCTLLTGASYFLLRREFREYRHLNRQIPVRAHNLLVTFGGSDEENATAGALQSLTMLPAGFLDVRVLVGSSNPHRATLEKLAAKLPHSVRFQTDTNRIADDMAWADLAISAAGSTSWELAFMGLPGLLVTLSNNQKGCATYLDNRGIAISLGWRRQVDPSEAAGVLSALAIDPVKRAEMSLRGKNLVDGGGADRVVQAMAMIANEQAQRKGALRLEIETKKQC